MFRTDDTIVAIATPAGAAGIGIVRLSGSSAHDIACRLMGRAAPLEARRATFGRVIDTEGPAPSAGRVLDQVVVTRFEAPRSFTGEDVVEIAAHGSALVLHRIVALAMHAGARLAEPGEFTLRAHLNGKLDLIQAEALADVVHAVTPLQARAAMDQLEGTLTQAIGQLEGALFDLVARLEASLDFPEEGYHFITRDEAAAALSSVDRALDALLDDGRAGRVIREGTLVVITGRPNAGKSSLFNALVGASRAIVTAIAGTTRDLLTERVDINGLAVTLVDTAGLRDAGDAIEEEGIRRAQQAQQIAALTLFVIDGAAPIHVDDQAAILGSSAARLVVVSKHDLGRQWTIPAEWPVDPADVIEVSVATGAGMEALRRAILRRLTDREEWRDPPAVSNARHLARLGEARTAVGEATELLQAGASEELIIAALTPAREALDAIVGRRTPDDVLHHIFSRFCLGK